MMRHHCTMVLIKIIQAAIRYGPQLIKAEGTALRRSGYRKSARYGIQTGLFGGAVVGSLINDDNQLDDSGKIQNGFKANTPDKTRSGPRKYSNSRYKSRSKSYHCKRCASTRKQYRSRNRR